MEYELLMFATRSVILEGGNYIRTEYIVDTITWESQILNLTTDPNYQGAQRRGGGSTLQYGTLESPSLPQLEGSVNPSVHGCL